MVGKAADFRVMWGIVPTANQLAFGILPMEAVFFYGDDTIFPTESLHEQSLVGIDKFAANPEISNIAQSLLLNHPQSGDERRGQQGMRTFVNRSVTRS